MIAEWEVTERSVLQRISTLEQRFAESQVRLRSLQVREGVDLRRELDRAVAENTSLKDQIVQIREERSDVASKLRTALDELDAKRNIQAELIAAEDAHEKASDELARAKNEIQKHRSQLESSSKTLESVRKRSRDLQANFRDALKDTRAAFRRERVNLNEAAHSRAREADAERDRQHREHENDLELLRRELKATELEMEGVAGAAAKSQERLQQANAAIQEVQGEIERLAGTIAEKEAVLRRLEDVESELHKSREHVKNAESRMKEAEASRDELLKTRDALLRYKNNNEIWRKQDKQKISRMELKITPLEEQAKSAESLREELRDLRQTYEELKAKVESAAQNGKPSQHERGPASTTTSETQTEQVQDGQIPFSDILARELRAAQAIAHKQEQKLENAKKNHANALMALQKEHSHKSKQIGKVLTELKSEMRKLEAKIDSGSQQDARIAMFSSSMSKVLDLFRTAELSLLSSATPLLEGDHEGELEDHTAGTSSSTYQSAAHNHPVTSSPASIGEYATTTSPDINEQGIVQTSGTGTRFFSWKPPGPGNEPQATVPAKKRIFPDLQSFINSATQSWSSWQKAAPSPSPSVDTAPHTEAQTQSSAAAHQRDLPESTQGQVPEVPVQSSQSQMYLEAPLTQKIPPREGSEGVQQDLPAPEKTPHITNASIHLRNNPKTSDAPAMPIAFVQGAYEAQLQEHTRQRHIIAPKTNANASPQSDQTGPSHEYKSATAFNEQTKHPMYQSIMNPSRNERTGRKASASFKGTVPAGSDTASTRIGIPGSSVRDESTTNSNRQSSYINTQRQQHEDDTATSGRNQL